MLFYLIGYKICCWCSTSCMGKRYRWWKVCDLYGNTYKTAVYL